jgi:hypothetical protein
MKSKFARLSKQTKERVEAEYHRRKAEDFDELMSAAVRESPNAIRLPNRLVVKLRVVAKRKGEPEYRKIVRAWIEERLEQENKLAG